MRLTETLWQQLQDIVAEHWQPWLCAAENVSPRSNPSALLKLAMIARRPSRMAWDFALLMDDQLFTRYPSKYFLSTSALITHNIILHDLISLLKGSFNF